MAEPFLIGNQRTGLELGLDPWLLPGDAYAKLNNFYLFQGRVHRRLGRKLFAEIHHDILTNGGFETGALTPWQFSYASPWSGSCTVSSANPAVGTYHARISTTTPGSDYNYAVLRQLVSVGQGKKYRVRFKAMCSEACTIYLCCQKDASPYTNYGLSEFVNLTTGYQTFEFTFTATGTDAAAKLGFEVGLAPAGSNLDIDDVQFYEYPALPVMGMFNYVTSAGTQVLLLFTTRRMYSYSNGVLTDLCGSDLFTGDDDNFFWLHNWLDKAFITNGVDPIYVYDGVNLTELVIDLDQMGGNDCKAPKFITTLKNRLLLFGTQEFGVRKAQRMRWSGINSYTDWPDANYVDASTSDWIQFGVFLKNDLLVWFERSIWFVRYTGDHRQPFIWYRLSGVEGTVSPMSIIDFENEILGMGPTRIVATDAQNVASIDDRIPRLILDMNQQELGRVYGGVYEPLDQVWYAYPAPGSTYPDQIIVLNYDENSWSRFLLAATCFGYYETADFITWNDLVNAWNTYSFKWGDRLIQAGYPIVLAGDQSGKIWEMLSGDQDDDGQPVQAELLTGQLNPYVKEGYQASLIYLDLLVDRQPDTHITVELYGDYGSAPYLSVTAPLDDGKGKLKAWVRIPVNVTSAAHQVGLKAQEFGNVTIHALLPWFEPGPRL